MNCKTIKILDEVALATGFLPEDSMVKGIFIPKNSSITSQVGSLEIMLSEDIQPRSDIFISKNCSLTITDSDEVIVSATNQQAKIIVDTQIAGTFKTDVSTLASKGDFSRVVLDADTIIYGILIPHGSSVTTENEVVSIQLSKAISPVDFIYVSAGCFMTIYPDKNVEIVMGGDNTSIIYDKQSIGRLKTTIITLALRGDNSTELTAAQVIDRVNIPSGAVIAKSAGKAVNIYFEKENFEIMPGLFSFNACLVFLDPQKGERVVEIIAINRDSYLLLGQQRLTVYRP